jgi:hypothetical protein
MALRSLDNLPRSRGSKVPIPSRQGGTDKSDNSLLILIILKALLTSGRAFCFKAHALIHKNLPVILVSVFIHQKKPERDGGLFYAGNDSFYSQHPG